MNKKVLFGVLFGLVAVVAARELRASQMSINDLPQALQDLNSRLAQTASKASPAKLMSYYYEDKEDSYHHAEEGYGKHAKKYAPKYEKEEKYEKYAPKYEHEEKYAPKYEEKYAPKYEEEYKPKYEVEEKYAAKDEYDYGYGPDKIVTKMWEKFRSPIRIQGVNADTFAFTSELTCTNPAEPVPVYAGADHGVLTLPIVAPATKLVTVGVCEWSVTKVAPQDITDTAVLKGSNQVVCTFNEEAERHCKNGEYLHKGLSLTGQGLVYGFAAAPEPVAPQVPMPVVVVQPPYPAKGPYAQTEAVEAAAVTPVNDVYLALINGVVNAKNLKYDNGALQYFYGPPAIPRTTAQTAYAVEAPVYPAPAPEVDPVGTYVFVFKH